MTSLLVSFSTLKNIYCPTLALQEKFILPPPIDFVAEMDLKHQSFNYWGGVTAPLPSSLATLLHEPIRRSFRYINKGSFALLYKALVRPILEYNNTNWHPCWCNFFGSEEILASLPSLFPSP